MSNLRRPSLCALVRHCCRRLWRLHLTGRELWGGALILSNVPVGWGGALVCSIVAESIDSPKLHFASIGIYLFSWLLLFAGIAMAGPEAARKCRRILPSAFRAWRRW